MADVWLTVAQAAEMSGYNAEYIRRLVRSGKIKAQKFAIVWQVSRASLTRHLRESQKSGRGPRIGGT